jgi:hypothetical protein
MSNHRKPEGEGRGPAGLDPARCRPFGAKFLAEQACAKDQIVEPIQQIYPTGKSLLIIGNRVKPSKQKYFA